MASFSNYNYCSELKYSISFFVCKDLQLEIEELQNLALLEIEDILQSNKKSLKDYPAMPFPRHVVLSHIGNIYIYIYIYIC